MGFYISRDEFGVVKHCEFSNYPFVWFKESEGESICFSYEEATALCEAITAHIFAETSKRNAEKAKAEWEAEKVGKHLANAAMLSAKAMNNGISGQG